MDDPRQKLEQVTLGVDTHAEQHVAAALDERGRLLGTCTIPTTSIGFAELGSLGKPVWRAYSGGDRRHR